MSDLYALDGPKFGPAAGGRPQSLVLLLHGLGADGNDLISLAPYWAQLLPNTEFVSPHAPFPCDMAPYGRQWFSLQDRTPAMMLAGVQAVAPALDGYVDEVLAEAALGDDRLVFVGFSQGTMMSLHVAPRRANAAAGIVGFSGALLAPERLAAEAASKPPTLLIHGDADPIVPFQAMTAAEQALRAAGVDVRTERRPGLPQDVSALVSALDGNSVTVELANVSLLHEREAIVQAGAFGEHEFTTVETAQGVEPSGGTQGTTVTDVNDRHFRIVLPPGRSVKMRLGMRRYAHTPSYVQPIVQPN